jgi:hypothetical protein
MASMIKVIACPVLVVLIFLGSYIPINELFFYKMVQTVDVEHLEI